MLKVYFYVFVVGMELCEQFVVTCFVGRMLGLVVAEVVFGALFIFNVFVLDVVSTEGSFEEANV